MLNNGEISLEELGKILNSINNETVTRMKSDIGFLGEAYKQQFGEVCRLCDELHGVTEYNQFDQAKTSEMKGKALEQLVRLLFHGTGEFYNVYANIRTTSNEVDVLVRLSEKGKCLKCFIDDSFHNIVCECKNHKKTIGVDYIGKFYSLVNYLPINFAIFFSWTGIGGKGSWRSSSGLIKKIFLTTKGTGQAIYIIDWDKEDFIKILNGESLFRILEKKKEMLEMECDIGKYLIQPHENAEEIRQLMEEINNKS